jgi:hypothetical protein
MSHLDITGSSSNLRSGSFTNRKFPPAKPGLTQQCLDDTTLGFVVMLERTRETKIVRVKDLDGHDLYVLSGVDITCFDDTRKRTYQRSIVARGTTGRLLSKMLRSQPEVRARAHMNGLNFAVCSVSEI